MYIFFPWSARNRNIFATNSSLTFAAFLDKDTSAAKFYGRLGGSLGMGWGFSVCSKLGISFIGFLMNLEPFLRNTQANQ